MPFVFVHFYWIYCCVAAHKIAKWCVSIHLSCLVHSSVIYSVCSGLCRRPCSSHSLCVAVLQAACVLGCEVWVFVAFAVSKALSVSLCSSVCLCVLQCAAPKDWSRWHHIPSHIHTMHTCVHTQQSQDILLHTHIQCWPSFWNASRHWNIYFHGK